MANSSNSENEETKPEEQTKEADAAATAKADHKAGPSKKDDSSFDSSHEKMGPDINKDGSKPRW